MNTPRRSRCTLSGAGPRQRTRRYRTGPKRGISKAMSCNIPSPRCAEVCRNVTSFMTRSGGSSHTGRQRDSMEFTYRHAREQKIHIPLQTIAPLRRNRRTTKGEQERQTTPLSSAPLSERSSSSTVSRGAAGCCGPDRWSNWPWPSWPWSWGRPRYGARKTATPTGLRKALRDSSLASRAVGGGRSA